MSRKKKDVILASGPVPLVSKAPPITLPRFLGIMPSWKRSDQISRKRKVPPKEYDLLGLLITLPVTLPISPAYGIGKAVMAVKGQAGEESDVESSLKRELLELRMRREANEISEDEYREREAELTRRLTEIRKR